MPRKYNKSKMKRRRYTKKYRKIGRGGGPLTPRATRTPSATERTTRLSAQDQLRAMRAAERTTRLSARDQLRAVRAAEGVIDTELHSTLADIARLKEVVVVDGEAMKLRDLLELLKSKDREILILNERAEDLSNKYNSLDKEWRDKYNLLQTTYLKDVIR